MRIKDIYPGIDWVFRYDDEGNFHHEFEIMPNARAIRWWKSYIPKDTSWRDKGQFT